MHCHFKYILKTRGIPKQFSFLFPYYLTIECQHEWLEKEKLILLILIWFLSGKRTEGRWAELERERAGRAGSEGEMNSQKVTGVQLGFHNRGGRVQVLVSEGLASSWSSETLSKLVPKAGTEPRKVLGLLVPG